MVGMRSRRFWQKISVILVVFAVLMAGAVILMKTGAADENRTMREGYGLPIMELSLAGTDLEQVNSGAKETKYKGNSLTLSDGGVSQRYSDVELKGRGNSTWGMVKKPYQIKFADKVDLLGLGKARKWVLLANFFDTTHLRNDAAFYLSRMLGEEYALQGQYVELYVDGEDVGLYYLTHKIEIGKNLVDLRDPLGIVVELDDLHGAEEICYVSLKGDCFGLVDVVNEDNSEMAMEGFLSSYNQLELAAESGDYERIKELADVESFAKYYLLSEFTVNPDAYTTSFFMYKDGNDDKIHAGPGWDFDLALANRVWVWQKFEDFFSPEMNRAREIEAIGGVYNSDSGETVVLEPELNISRIVYNMIKVPEFQDEVQRVYIERMSGHWGELEEYMINRAAEIWRAAEVDNEKWDREGDFVTEFVRLKDWMRRRFEHFEIEYGDIVPIEEMNYGESESITEYHWGRME